MAITKQPDGTWKLDMRVAGRGSRRVRKVFTTKAEALGYERYILKEVDDKPWLGNATQDNRSLWEMMQRWHDLHGQQLTDPEKRMRKLRLICDGLGNPIASKLTVNDFATFRQMRLDGEIADGMGIKQKVKPHTVNHEHAYLSAVFSELKRLGEWTLPNPLEGLSQFKIDEMELAFLYAEEIPLVLAECDNSKNPHLTTVVKICLSTGCRWSEAESLRGSQVVNNRITFIIKTKGKKNRTVPISKALADEIPQSRGSLFSSCRKAFAQAIKRTGLTFPEGQMTHILRHTFASHFMMNGGNILVLKQILGHADIKETMRYAHFAPEHLDDAITKNPLANLND